MSSKRRTKKPKTTHTDNLFEAYDTGGLHGLAKYQWNKTHPIARALLVGGVSFLTACGGYKYMNSDIDQELDNYATHGQVEQFDNTVDGYQEQIRKLLR
jgi:hypothetical protein